MFFIEKILQSQRRKMAVQKQVSRGDLSAAGVARRHREGKNEKYSAT